MSIIVETPSYEDLFTEQYNEYSRRIYRIPNWQLNACKETYNEISHYRRRLELVDTSGNLTMGLDIPTKDLKIAFVFDNEKLVVKFNGTRKLGFRKDKNLSGVMTYIIDKIYESGNITPYDMMVITTIANQTEPCEGSEYQEAINTLNQFKKDKRKGLYPDLDKNTIDIANTLLAAVPGNGLCKAKIELADRGHSLAFVYERNKKKIYARVKYTSAIEKNFFVLYQTFDDNKMIESRVLVDDIEEIATFLNGKIAFLSKVKNKK